MQANVRSAESLDQLRTAVLELSRRLGDLSFELSAEADRALHWAQVEAPEYWKRQLSNGQRQLQESLENLASIQTTYGGRDKPAATEAKQRVARLRRRVEFCRERLAACKRWEITLRQAADQMGAGLSGLRQQCEGELPVAAARLARWSAAIQRYAAVVRSGGANLSPPDVSPSEPTEPDTFPVDESAP